MKIFVAWILKLIFEFLFGKAKEAIVKNEIEKEATKKDQATVKDAVAELRTPIDQSKSKEEKDKDEESKFDRFHGRLK